MDGGRQEAEEGIELVLASQGTTVSVTIQWLAASSQMKATVNATSAAPSHALLRAFPRVFPRAFPGVFLCVFLCVFLWAFRAALMSAGQPNDVMPSTPALSAKPSAPEGHR